MTKLKVLDLFSGIGGFSLGLERAGFKTIAFCEIDQKARLVLRKHWSDIPIITDIKNIQSKIDVDLICGGFPCQPFSSAARGRNNAIDLWPEMSRVIRLIHPEWVIAENVKESPIRQAQKDLEVLGYGTWAKRIGAHEAGGDHQRNRWWVVAHANHESKFQLLLNAEMARLPELCKNLWGWSNFAGTIRIPDGVSNRMDRLKQVGNSVLPQIPELIGRAISNGTL